VELSQPKRVTASKTALFISAPLLAAGKTELPSADLEPDDSVSLAGRPAEHRLVSVTDFFRAHSLSDLRRGAGRIFAYRDPAAHTYNE